MLRVLEDFLQDVPPRPNPLAGLGEQALMLVHKIPPLANAYFEACRLADRVLYGKRVKLDRYTGEPVH
jgi:hypothetical protein